jgi:hypothetical protein
MGFNSGFKGLMLYRELNPMERPKWSMDHVNQANPHSHPYPKPPPNRTGMHCLQKWLSSWMITLNRLMYIDVTSLKHDGKYIQSLQRLRDNGGELHRFDVGGSVHHHTIQINQPTRCNSFTSLLPDVYVSLNMFRVPPRPSSGAYNCIILCFFITHFRHQASPRVSPRRSTQRRKLELWARNVRWFCLNADLHVTFTDLLHVVKQRLPLRRKACWGIFFFALKKSDVFGRVRTRELGYQRPARYLWNLVGN